MESELVVKVVKKCWYVDLLEEEEVKVKGIGEKLFKKKKKKKY